MNNFKVNIFKKLTLTIIIIAAVFLLTSCLCIFGDQSPYKQGTSESTESSQSLTEVEEPEITDDIVIDSVSSELISKLKITGQAIDLKVSGDYIYVTNDLGYLYVIDSSDIKNPKVIGKCSGIDSANIVFIDGSYAYISYTKYDMPEDELYISYGFKIVDIRNKENPQVVGDWGGEVSGEDISVHGLYAKGDYAFLSIVNIKDTSTESSFKVIDITSKNNPVEIGSIEGISGSANAVWFENDYAFFNLIKENDISQFADAGEIKVSQEEKKKSYFYVVDLKNKKSPIISGSCEVISNSWGLITSGDHAYLSSNNYDEMTKKYYDSFVQIIDIRDKKSPVPVSSIAITGGAWEMDYKNGFLFVSNLNGGYDALDVKDGSQPIKVDSIKTKGQTYDIEVFANYAYLADGFEGVKIYKLDSEQGSSDNNDGAGNKKPKADFEVRGDNEEVDVFETDNPVFISALDSYDPNGDELTYSWEVTGSSAFTIQEYTDKKDKASLIFKEPGDYTVKLTVSDGSLEDSASHYIKIIENNSPVKIKSDHEFTVEIITTIKNNSSVLLEDLECNFKTPQNFYPFQTIVEINSQSGEQQIFFDNDFNKVINLKFDDLEPYGQFKAVLECSVIMPELSIEKINSSALNYEADDPDLTLYTSEDLFIDSDSEIIKNIASKVIGNEKNPYEISKKLYSYVVKNFEYDYERAADKNYEFYYASELPAVGKGVCADYAIYYTALLRASGIPSRIAAGIAVEGALMSENNEIDFGHAWVEIKLPGYGWISVDPTTEDSFFPKINYLNLVTERGSSFLHKSVTMDWSSYYFDGFTYTWEGSERPKIEQNISYRVNDLNLYDLLLYN